MTSVIFIKRKYDLTKVTQEEVILEFKNALEGRVLEAYFFGSFAKKTLTSDSDLDLILIVENPKYKNFIERPLEFSDLIDLFPELDILVYTPSEFKEKCKTETQGFWQEIMKSKIRII